MTLEKKSRAKRLRYIAAALGALLGLLCHLLPHDYQTACTTITKVAAMSCGAGG